MPGSTTHVVALLRGNELTHKVKAAMTAKDVWLVKPDWLWFCGFFLERQDESLFALLSDRHGDNNTLQTLNSAPVALK